jgi:S1-C subfamily serine protease
MVASLGNAYGIGRPSVGIGPVTYLRRSIAATADSDSDAAPLRGLIEAHSNIQPGESGSPMVNQDGEVIGMNVAYEKTQGSPASDTPSRSTARSPWTTLSSPTARMRAHDKGH